MSRRRKKVFPVFLWHRRLGLVALFFIMILSITGIMLNHTESLSLDEHRVDSSWILDWYGLNPRSEPSSFKAGDHVITRWDNQLFFDTQPLMNSQQLLRGAVMLDNMIAVGLDNSIVLVSLSGELIERINTEHTFPRIIKVGTHEKRLLVKTAGDEYYRADAQVIDWQSTGPDSFQGSEPVTIDIARKQKLLEAYRGRGLTVERVILDLHSGRIFNTRWGVYIMDASAVILLWLGFSGLWVWMSRRRKMKTKKHYRKHH